MNAEAELNAKEAVEHLAAIRRIMESATQLTVLPGKAAIAGGVLALAACAMTQRALGSWDFSGMNALDAPMRMKLIALWSATAVLGIVVDVALTVLAARKRGVSPWSRLSRLAAYAMAPGIAAGTVLTLALGQAGYWGLVPAVWMMLYGGAVWTASVFSVRAPGVLGALFFAAGVATAFWLSSVSLLMVAATFGLAHIVFGIYLIAKFGD